MKSSTRIRAALTIAAIFLLISLGGANAVAEDEPLDRLMFRYNLANIQGRNKAESGRREVRTPAPHTTGRPDL